MVLETFKITLKHDNGTLNIKVDSLSGEQGAIAQVLFAEGCPKGAISKIQKVGQKII